MIHRAYRYRLYPDHKQEAYLCQNIGCKRFVWNKLVENFNSWSPEFSPPRINEKILKDNPEYTFLKDAASVVLQQTHRDFLELKKQFFNKKRKTKIGRPRFKKKGVGVESIRFSNFSIGLSDFTKLASGLKLPKLDKPIKIILDREFTGRPLSVTVSVTPTGKWFASVLVEEEVQTKPLTGRATGIDMGLIDLFTLSNGLKLATPKLFRKNQAKLARAQRHMSRKKKGSNRYKKQCLKVARIHEKIRDQRWWLYHNLTTSLVTNYDLICVESLNVKGMVRNRKLAKSISDASFSTFISMLEYKCAWYGKTFHKVDRWFASSKTCNHCGCKVDALPLNVREWTCPSCGTHLDRDVNAARNILDEGTRDLYGDHASAVSADYRRGEDVRPNQLADEAASMKRLASCFG